MKLKLSAFGILFSALLPMVPQSMASEISSSELRFNEYYAKVRGIDGADALRASIEASRVFDEFYPTFLNDQESVGASPEAIHLLIRAIAARNFYTQQDGDVSDMRAALKRLESIGQDSRTDWDGYFRSLMLMRNFEEAARVQARFPDWFPPLPSVVRSHDAVSHGRMLWRVDRNTNSLLLEAPEISKGMHLVVISHPACKFSQAAMIAFETDPRLRTLPIIWIAPPDRHLDFDLVGAWNARHPAVPVHLADQASQWGFEQWSTPSFYLLQNGKVIRHRAGWSADGTDHQAMLQFIGTGVVGR